MAKNIMLIVFVLGAFAGLGAYNNIAVRDSVEKTYLKEVGVRELTGHNDGQRVQEYLAAVNLQGNYAWCAAFVSWVYTRCGVCNIHNAWVANWFTDKNRIVYARNGIKGQPQKGDAVGFWWEGMNYMGHIGFFHKKESDKIWITCEGNTNGGGSADGDGVYLKRRLVGQVYMVSAWIK